MLIANLFHKTYSTSLLFVCLSLSAVVFVTTRFDTRMEAAFTLLAGAVSFSFVTELMIRVNPRDYMFNRILLHKPLPWSQLAVVAFVLTAITLPQLWFLSKRVVIATPASGVLAIALLRLLR